MDIADDYDKVDKTQLAFLKTKNSLVSWTDLPRPVFSLCAKVGEKASQFERD